MIELRCRELVIMLSGIMIDLIRILLTKVSVSECCLVWVVFCWWMEDVFSYTVL